MFFRRVGFQKASQNQMIEVLFRKRRFCKNCQNTLTKQWFLMFVRFRTSKNPCEIHAKTHSKKTSEKNLPEIDLYLHLGLQKPPQIDPGREKTGSRTKPVSRRYANHPEIVESQRASELWDGQTS
jgi:hypothetical protein